MGVTEATSVVIAAVGGTWAAVRSTVSGLNDVTVACQQVSDLLRFPTGTAVRGHCGLPYWITVLTAVVFFLLGLWVREKFGTLCFVSATADSDPAWSSPVAPAVRYVPSPPAFPGAQSTAPTIEDAPATDSPSPARVKGKKVPKGLEGLAGDTWY